MADIFSEIQMGDVSLVNRMIMAPMTRCRAGGENGHIDYPIMGTL